MTNYAEPQHDGHSIACSPDGAIVASADEAEGVWLANFDPNWIRTWRATKMWGDAFRRPSVYAPLGDIAVAEPFVRKDLFGEPLPHRHRT